MALSAGTVGAVTIDTVFVGNAGNAGELSGAGAGGYGPDRICGGVAHTYNIGKYEVTAGQYTEFLNKVAATDTYGLYYADMWMAPYNCDIHRSGTSGSYTYSVPLDSANRPVNYVSWGNAARFANWMHNGQPSGAQDASTTEDGSYYLNGATSDAALLAVARKPNATWVIPSEDEWYKAAYHKNDGVTGYYFDYPTSSDSMPSNVLGYPTDPGNNATCYDGYGTGTGGHTIGSPHYRTEVGAHENSASPYGTFDQGGNVQEWTEAIVYIYGNPAHRSMRGGSWFDDQNVLHAAYRQSLSLPTYEHYHIGFRVAELLEPDSDGDGVPNDIDNCPNTIPGAPVDAWGCPPLIPGDFDRDGDVDEVDTTTFVSCVSGPNVPWSAACEVEDLDTDGDVDLGDFGTIQRCHSGSGVPALANCGP